MSFGADTINEFSNCYSSVYFVQNPQQSHLCELLNQYMRNGVPKSKSSYVNSDYSDEALDALYGLPQSWRDFVIACDISETDTKIQSAIWELVATEVDYIHAIQTVTDVSVSPLSLCFTSLCRWDKNYVSVPLIDLRRCSRLLIFKALAMRELTIRTHISQCRSQAFNVQDYHVILDHLQVLLLDERLILFNVNSSILSDDALALYRKFTCVNIVDAN